MEIACKGDRECTRSVKVGYDDGEVGPTLSRSNRGVVGVAKKAGW